MTASPWAGAFGEQDTLGFTSETVDTVRGTDKCRLLLAEFETWVHRFRPVTTATPGWLFAALESGFGCEPWGVAVRADNGRLVGVAFFVNEQTDYRVVTTLAGTDQRNRGMIAVESPEIAERIGDQVGKLLRSGPPSTQLLLGPLDANDPAVHAFAAAIPGARVVHDDPIPTIAQDSSVALEYLSQGMRRTLRKARNRLAKDGRRFQVRFTTDPARITDSIPQLEVCHRARDHVHDRLSDLDDPRTLCLWRSRIARLGASGILELATLEIDGDFAAHVLGVLDGHSYRVLEGRFKTELARYAPGRLLEAAVLQRVLDDERFQCLDWMTAVAPEKLLATNAQDEMVSIHWVGVS